MRIEAFEEGEDLEEEEEEDSTLLLPPLLFRLALLLFLWLLSGCSKDHMADRTKCVEA